MTDIQKVFGKSRKGAKSRENNHNWRGRRIVTEHGYVMIRVGTEHHLSDCRGYAYEHRLVAEANIGRHLQPGEEVHHRNKHDTQNNDWSNLKVCSGRHEHKVEHRPEGGKRLRLPNEENLLVDCACGSGEKLKQFDAEGRYRQYITGHNSKGHIGRNNGRFASS